MISHLGDIINIYIQTCYLLGKNYERIHIWNARLAFISGFIATKNTQSRQQATLHRPGPQGSIHPLEVKATVGSHVRLILVTILPQRLPRQ